MVADYVLNNARREEQELIDPAWERSLELLPLLAEGRLTDAMKWLHTAEKPAAETEPKEKGKE
jgi:PTH1 family peptidyl-tRNA hydrolase